ncbi:AGAP006275-PA-like protein [Anopheles sinensis]|uniref:AGAP006275-PA-like protein n=1 Tax=Anopheles sinensis TaxID=74873 RepID=A0A084WKF1_ANOSI|nr:AGAP006275-PA-like protein [Anopheles sinensis]
MCAVTPNTNSDRPFVNHVMGMCYDTYIDKEMFISDFNLLSNETRTTFFPRYCPKIKKVGSCLNDWLQSAKRCIEESEYTFNKAAVDTFPHLVDLICENDGEILFRLDENNYNKCIVAVKDIRLTCATPLFRLYNDWDMSHLTTSQCGVINDMKHCAVRKLNMCQAPELDSLYDRFHNELIRDTPCREKFCPNSEED